MMLLLLTLIVLSQYDVTFSGTVSKVRYQFRVERSNEYRIKQTILRHYDHTTRPVRNDKTPVNVLVAISLYHILDTNEKQQTFTCLLAVRATWQDEYLTWKPDEYDNISTIRVPADALWTPDLVISNFAGDKFNDYMTTNAIVQSDGTVLWLFPALIKTYCTLNVKYFPFDTQKCDIQFISWTFSGHELNISYNSTSFENAMYYKPENQEWRVDEISTERHETVYACCVEPYPDVTFTIHMRRGSLFYVVNLIAPCFLIFLISFLGFFLPVESGDKVNLETTILLALVVFLLMVGETMPPTPDAIPILGMFFGSTMVMVTIALVMAVIVTNIYAKKESPERAPDWCIALVSRFYPAYFLPQRPSNDHSGETGSGAKNAKRKRKCASDGCEISISTVTTGNEFPVMSLKRSPLAYCRKLQGKGVGNETGNGPAQKPEVAAGADGNAKQQRRRRTASNSFEVERYDAEWRLIAKFTDRVFFWIFLALSACVQTLLFIQMVPLTRDKL